MLDFYLISSSSCSGSGSGSGSDQVMKDDDVLDKGPHLPGPGVHHIELYETVMEKSCRTVQEDVCDDPDNPEVKTECSVVMEEVCETIQEEQCR